MIVRLLVVFFLGFSSGLPLALLGSTLQAWFAKSGMSVMATGALSLIGLPYVYRLIWSPLLDRYSFSSLGRRRSWMLATQLLLFFGFVLMTWFEPGKNAMLMAGLAFLLACFSATQDVAIEAQRTEYLRSEEYGLGASLAVLGYRVGMLISGGLALIIAARFGFAATYRLMALLMLPGILTSLLSREPHVAASAPVSLREQYARPIADLLFRPGVGAVLAFIFFYKAGEAFTSTTSGVVMPFLISGMGFSIETIGWVNKIVGVAAVIGGGIIAGLMLMRYSLLRCLMIFGLLQALTNFSFVILVHQGKQLPFLLTAVISDNLATGMGTTALVAFLMQYVNQKYTATQLSLLVAFSTLPRIFSGPVAALLQKSLGWAGLYQCSVMIALIYVPFLWFISRNDKKRLFYDEVLDIEP